MKSKSLILFLVAAGFGLVAMLGVMQVMEARTDEEPDVKVMVAVAEIFPGDALDETNTGFKTLPKSAAPRGAVTDRSQTEEMTVISRVVADDFITLTKLSEGMIAASRDIPIGMRVATVKVDSTKSHSGLLRPGDRVDVLCTYKQRDERGQNTTKAKTVLEYIEVFATDNIRNNGEGDPGDVQAKNISLLVQPEQAALLKLAEDKGELHLSLRHKDDIEVAAVPDIDSTFFDDAAIGQGERRDGSEAKKDDGRVQVFVAAAPQDNQGDEETEEEPEVEIPTWTITIYRGDDVEDVEVIDEEALADLGLDAKEMQRARADTRRANQPRETARESVLDEAAKDAVNGGQQPSGTQPGSTQPTQSTGATTVEQSTEDTKWIEEELESIRNF